MARIRECERMLVALQLCGELNDAHLCLQVVVQCYGLLAPILHYKVAALPALQVRSRTPTAFCLDLLFSYRF